MEAIGGCKEKSNMNPPLQGVHALASLKPARSPENRQDAKPSWPH